MSYHYEEGNKGASAKEVRVEEAAAVAKPAEREFGTVKVSRVTTSLLAKSLTYNKDLECRQEFWLHRTCDRRQGVSTMVSIRCKMMLT